MRRVSSPQSAVRSLLRMGGHGRKGWQPPAVGALGCSGVAALPHARLHGCTAARLHGCTVAGLRETVATHRTLEGLELQNERNRIMRLELLLAMGTTSLALSATVVHHTPRACSRARNRACNRARNCACSRACSRAVTARGVGLHATACLPATAARLQAAPAYLSMYPALMHIARPLSSG